jgi:hypothetical protein
MNLETAIEKLFLEIGQEKYLDKAPALARTMSDLSGDCQSISDAKFNKLLKLAKVLKSMDIK